jgi:hypothetical protein
MIAEEQDTRCTIHVISKNAWSLIAPDLSVQDLIQLRGTCHRLNDVVRGMNARWYRAHQRFLSEKVAVSKVKCKVKCHIKKVDPYCIPRNHHLLKGLNGWNQVYHAKCQMIANGELNENDCCKRSCWSYKVPSKEEDIPLDPKHYKPKRNVYMFWYLIECYRYYKKRDVANIRYYSDMVRDCQQRRWRMESEIQRLTLDQVAYQEKLEVAQNKNKTNLIFDGQRINSYKGFKKKKKSST